MLRMALKELRRMKGRALTVIVLFALSIALVSVVSNLAESEMETLREIHRKYSIADVTLRISPPINVSRIEEAGIGGIDGVEEVDFALEAWGAAFVGDEYVYVQLWGIKGKPKLNAINVDKAIWNSFSGNCGIIDKRVANMLSIKVGDVITVFLSGKYIDIKIITLADMGWAINFGWPIILTIAMPHDALAEFLGVSREAYNVILIDVASGYNATEVAEEAKSRLEQLGVFCSYHVIEFEELEAYAEQYVIVFSAVLAPIFVVAAIFVSILMMLKIAQEFRVLGIKRAVGYTPAQAFLETYLIGLLLYAISIPVALAFDYVMTKLVAMLIYERMLGTSELVEVKLSSVGFIGASVILLVIVAVAMLFPALKASRVKVSDALRYGFEPPKVSLKARKTFKRVFLAYALRGLFSRRLRAIMLLMSLILGVALASSAISLADSIPKSVDLGTKYLNADMVIGLRGPQEMTLLDEIKNVDGVNSAWPATRLYIAQKNFLLIGGRKEVQLDKFAPVLLLFVGSRDVLTPKIIAGRLPERPSECFISYRLKLAYGLEVGDEITVSDTKANRSFTLRIAGYGLMQDCNGKVIVMMLEEAYSAGLIPNGTFTEVLIKVEEGAKVSEVAKRLIDLLKDKVSSLVLVSERPGLESIVKALNAFSVAISSVVLLCVAICYAGVGVITAQGRRYEIGVLKSIGMTNGDITRLLMLEATIVSLLVAPFSAILAAIVAQKLSEIVTISSGIEVLVESPLIPIALGALIAVCVTLISTVPSVLVARRYSPAELFRQLM